MKVIDFASSHPPPPEVQPIVHAIASSISFTSLVSTMYNVIFDTNLLQITFSQVVYRFFRECHEQLEDGRM